MKVVVNGVVTAERTFPAEDDLIAAYREEAVSQGKAVPSHSLMYLLLQISEFILAWAGTRTLDTLADWKKERQARREREEDAERSDLLLQRLDSIEAALAARNEQPSLLLPEAARAGLNVEIVLETKAEAALARNLAKEVPEVVIKIRTGNE